VRVRSIKSFIIGVAILVSLVLFSGTYLYVSALYADAVRRDAAADARLFARLTFNSMFEIMRLGWSRNQLESFLEQNQAAFGDDPVTLNIHRGPAVEALYGAIPGKPRHALVYDVQRDGTERELLDGDLLRILQPLAARDVCLTCHHNARRGDVLGVIEVEHDLGARIAAAQSRFFLAFLPIVPVSLLVAVLLALFITRRLGRAFTELHRNIDGIKHMSDLESITAANANLGFSEFTAVLLEIEQLARRLREIGVDRDLLEFEIRLLEKFVITSDVVRDWRDYINQLLLEINHVITTFTLFSIFKVDDEKYELEVFWRGAPTANGRDTLEGIVRQTLAQHRLFGDASPTANTSCRSSRTMTC
jgi:hypothetical protein